MCFELDSRQQDVDLTLEMVRGILGEAETAERQGFEMSAVATPSLGTFQAAVAMVFRQRSGLEVLLIERAHRDGDPWSGQVAMPGGRRGSRDQNLIHTAMRETAEEVGVGLDLEQWLGGVGDHQGLGRASRRRRPLVVSGHAFAVAAETDVGAVQTSEVAGTFWVPVAHLLDPGTAVHYRFEGLDRLFPGIVLPDGENVLWGLTYRFLDRVLAACGSRLAPPNKSSPTLGS